MTGMIEQWVALELAAWNGFAIEPPALAAGLADIAQSRRSVFLFHIDDGRVSLDDKSSGYAHLADPGYHAVLLYRARIYARFLEQALAGFGVRGRGTLALELEDLGGQRFAVPVFAFQKRRGANTILLPDIDLIERDWYVGAAYEDPIPYDDKRAAAIFVGSTTGDPIITAAHVRGLRNARLRSAVFFRDRSDVVFDLPVIVQTDTPETYAMVEALDVKGRFRDWQEQHGYRYLLSMDGNGATCSRVYLALAGNGILAKYNSPYLLYYFHGLEPWRHYVPVMGDGDVLDLLAEAPRHDALHRAIAERSRVFARDHIARPHMLRYAAHVIGRYLARYGEGAFWPEVPPLLIDVRAHVAGGGDIWAQPAGWIGDGRGAIEGLALVPGPEIAAADIALCVAGPEGVLSRPAPGHAFCGSHGRGRPLHGLQILLKGAAAARFALSYEARFLDGSASGPVAEGTALLSPSPLSGLRLTVTPR